MYHLYNTQSPNSETQPRERMYRITTMYPEDPRQPFYNSKASTMTPLAKLYIRKQKSIPHQCNDDFLQSQVLDVSENTEEGDSRRKHYVFFARFLTPPLNIPRIL